MFYDNAIQDHEAFNKTVSELQSWLNSTLQSIISCKETNLDRISLLASLKAVQVSKEEFSLINLYTKVFLCLIIFLTVSNRFFCKNVNTLIGHENILK